MKLGEIARVRRGVVTGNRALFVMTRTQAKERGIEVFVKPIVGGARDLPKSGAPVVRDGAHREVIIVASQRDVEQHSALRKYLAGSVPRIATVHPAPIAATYVGIPRFVANPDALVVTNALYAVTPRQSMNNKEILALVERLNASAARLQKGRFADRYSPRAMELLEI